MLTLVAWGSRMLFFAGIPIIGCLIGYWIGLSLLGVDVGRIVQGAARRDRDRHGLDHFLDLLVSPNVSSAPRVREPSGRTCTRRDERHAGDGAGHRAEPR